MNEGNAAGIMQGMAMAFGNVLVLIIMIMQGMVEYGFWFVME